jgi:hypothetical protein
MIKHIVMFKLKEEFNGKSAYENAVEAKEKAEKLKDLVPYIKEMEVVVNTEKAPDSNYEIALVCDFENIDDLNKYQEHEEHKKFGKYITEIRTGRACIDYEY